MGKTYLITGAAGRLGRNIVEIICMKNIDNVQCLKLLDIGFAEETKVVIAECAKDSGITIRWIQCDVTDLVSLTSAFYNVDVVMHAASVIDLHEKFTEKQINNINVQGTANVLTSCLVCDVQHLIYTSTMMVCGPNADRVPFLEGSEHTPYPTKLTSAYSKSKSEAEALVFGANGRITINGKNDKLGLTAKDNIICREDATKLITCSLRPGGLYGGSDDPLLQWMVGRLRTTRNRLLRALSSRDALQERMHIGNAAWCHVIAAKVIQTKGEKVGGAGYFLGDDTPKLSNARLNEQFFFNRGYRIAKPEPYIPYWLLITIVTIAHFMAKLLAMLGVHVFQNTMKPEMVRPLCTNFTTSHDRFVAHFGYKPIFDWEESLAKTRDDVEKIFQADD